MICLFHTVDEEESRADLKQRVLMAALEQDNAVIVDIASRGEDLYQLCGNELLVVASLANNAPLVSVLLEIDNFVANLEAVDEHGRTVLLQTSLELGAVASLRVLVEMGGKYQGS